MKGRVTRLFTAPTAGAPMKEHTSVIVRAGAGILGDRYALGIGQYSNIDDKIRHVTFIAQEAIDASNAMLVAREMPKFWPRDTRRNILTEGVELNALVGVEFVVGSIVFRGVELADPCHRPSALVQRRGFKALFENRGGLRAEALTEGELRVGDSFQ
jgi:hypothetical protein